MRRRALLAARGTSGGGNEEVRVIKFYVSDSFTDETTEYEAMSNMTWEEWIDSDYNPYLPDGSEKRFSKTRYYDGYYSGYVWYHLWDSDYNQIDMSGEVIDITSYSGAVPLGNRIIEDNLYEA